MGGRANRYDSILIQESVSCRCLLLGGIYGCGHAPADQIAIFITFPAWIRVSLGPHEFLSATFITFAQPFTRPRFVLVFVLLRIVAKTKLDRVATDLMGQFIHGALEG